LGINGTPFRGIVGCLHFGHFKLSAHPTKIKYGARKKPGMLGRKYTTAIIAINARTRIA